MRKVSDLTAAPLKYHSFITCPHFSFNKLSWLSYLFMFTPQQLNRNANVIPIFITVSLIKLQWRQQIIYLLNYLSSFCQQNLAHMKIMPLYAPYVCLHVLRTWEYYGLQFFHNFPWNISLWKLKSVKSGMERVYRYSVWISKQLLYLTIIKITTFFIH